MTEQQEQLQPAFSLAPSLVRRFVAGELDPEGQATLAEQVARLLPFHTELPNPLISRLTELIGHLGSEAALLEWLDNFPGRPGKVARLFMIIGLLDRFSAEPAVVNALSEFREHTPYPPGLRRYLVPDTNAETLAGLSWHIESLLAHDQVDDAVRLALDTTALLEQIAPRAAELNRTVADLAGLVDRARQDLLDAITTDRLLRDRRDAGRVLAGMLEQYRDRDDVVVLGLPRGGVPVAYEVATALGVVLDIFLVRKLGLPDHPEVAMGAIAGGGLVVINDDVIRGFGVAPDVIQRVAEQEGRELARRERAYRDGIPRAGLTGRTVIIVDDGLATGASMRAAIQAVRKLRPARLVVAVPAAPKSTCEELALEVDEVVCATTPSPFFAVSASYWDFTQTTDEQVRDLLRAAARSRPARISP